MTVEGSNPEPEEVRFKPLDGLRGIAVLIVVIYHYVFTQLHPQPGTALYALRAPLKLAWCGVDLFFVLSGFLITTILVRARGSSNYFTVFYMRRVCRILPLYILLLVSFLFAAALLPPTNNLVSDPIPFWTYPLFVQNIAMAVTGKWGATWLAATWSLAVEEQFYLVMPLIVLLISPRRTIPVLLALAALAMILRFSFPGFHVTMSTPFRGEGLIYGALLAYLMMHPGFVEFCRQRTSLLHGALLVGVAGFPVLALHREWFGPFDFTWICGFFVTVLLVVLVRPRGRIATVLSRPVLLWFGNVSYAIYMIHEPVLGLAHLLLTGKSDPMIHGVRDTIVTMAAFGISCCLAALSGRYFERPIRKFGRRWQYRRAPVFALAQ